MSRPGEKDTGGDLTWLVLIYLVVILTIIAELFI